MLSPDSNSSLRLAIVGPGRAGQALARRCFESAESTGIEFAGFLGRSIQSSKAAARFVGGGRVLDASELAAHDLVMLAVQDDRLSKTVAALAAHAGPGLWFHCSGGHDRGVLEPLAAGGASIGSLHPLCPFPDPETGYRNLSGRAAVLEAGSDSSVALLERFARAVGLEPIRVADGADRLLYHTACVLAANGVVALHDIVTELFQTALPGVDGQVIPSALMGAALQNCSEQGALAALSGPVLRGDTRLIERQRARLAEISTRTDDVFVDLMQRAASMALQRGALSGQALSAMRAALSRPSRHPGRS